MDNLTRRRFFQTGVSLTDRSIYVVLANIIQDEGMATKDYIAKTAGVSCRTIDRSIKSLEDIGWIEIKRTPYSKRSGKKGINYYCIVPEIAKSTSQFEDVEIIEVAGDNRQNDVKMVDTQKSDRQNVAIRIDIITKNSDEFFVPAQMWARQEDTLIGYIDEAVMDKIERPSKKEELKKKKRECLDESKKRTLDIVNKIIGRSKKVVSADVESRKESIESLLTKRKEVNQIVRQTRRVEVKVHSPVKKKQPNETYRAVQFFYECMNKFMGIENAIRPSKKDLGMMKRFINRVGSIDDVLKLIEHVVSNWRQLCLVYKLRGYPSLNLICSKYGESWMMELKFGKIGGINATKMMDEKEEQGTKEAIEKALRGEEEGF